MRKIRVLFLILASGFLMNLVWENLHSVLYAHYKGGQITSDILTRAALFDAFTIAILGFLFLSFPILRRHLWLALPIGLLFAIGLEKWALETGRWAYTSAMPIIPFINVGLTPAIQLGLTAYLSFLAVFRRKNL